MYWSPTLLAQMHEPEDYPLAEKEEKTPDGWVLSTEVYSGSTRANGYGLCDLHIRVINPDGGEWWTNLGPIWSKDGVAEAKDGMGTAHWVKEHWKEALEEFYSKC